MINYLLKDYLEKIEIGKPQQFKNAEIFPIFISDEETVFYLTLKEALEKDELIIKEISEEASVPEVQVINNSEHPVLLLDGEEIIGAKQNRIVNTTILLKEKSKTIVPVSCTEQGRWNYNSEHFEKSENVAFLRMRMGKTKDVSESLKRKKRFDSDQGKVWHGVREMAMKSNISSDTDAMHDIYFSKEETFQNYLEKFRCEQGQRGLVAIINGEIAGMDILSRKSAYKILHQKLLKSYLLETINSDNSKKEYKYLSSKEVKEFLEKILNCDEKYFDSIGYGKDHRFEDDNIVGSALIYKNTVIHTAFFNILEKSNNHYSENLNGMSDYNTRRNFRR